MTIASTSLRIPEVHTFSDGIADIGYVDRNAHDRRWFVVLDRTDVQIRTSFETREKAEAAGFAYYIELELAEERVQLYDDLGIGVAQ